MIQISKSASRLPSYRRTLLQFKNLGFDKVFSESIAEAAGVTPSQVRKDFSYFGISGNKKGGYRIDTMLERLHFLLKKDVSHSVVLAGVGNIGSALLNYKTFEKEGIVITAGFDIDPSKINKKSRVPILPVEEMDGFLKKQNIKIGIITVPAITAQAVCDRMVASGIKGILNFAPIRLKVPSSTVVENVSVLLKVEKLIYFVNSLV